MGTEQCLPGALLLSYDGGWGGLLCVALQPHLGWIRLGDGDYKLPLELQH